MTWNDAIAPALAEAIEYERLRQHTDEARRWYLLAGWERAKAAAEAGEALTLELLLELAGLVEPDNHGRLRTTPVVFDNGGYASPPGQVEAGVSQLIRFWPGQDASDEERNHWVREFLIVHPFTDGNGRAAWVLLQWLMNAWGEPMRLPYFDF